MAGNATKDENEEEEQNIVEAVAQHTYWWVVQPAVLQIKSLAILSCYAWVRVFLDDDKIVKEEQKRANTGAVGLVTNAIVHNAELDPVVMFAYGLCVATLLFTFVWAVTWRQESRVVLLEREIDDDDNTLPLDLHTRLLTVTIQKKLSSLACNLLCVVATLSLHFAVLSSGLVPVEPWAMVAYNCGVAASCFGITSLRGFISMGTRYGAVLRHCLCFCCCAWFSLGRNNNSENAKGELQLFAMVKKRTVVACEEMACAIMSVIMAVTINDCFARLLSEAQSKGVLDRREVMAVKSASVVMLFLVSAVVIVVKFRLAVLHADIENAVGRGAKIMTSVLTCSCCRCCRLFKRCLKCLCCMWCAKSEDEKAQTLDYKYGTHFAHGLNLPHFAHGLNLSQLINRTLLYTTSVSLFWVLKFAIDDDGAADGRVSEGESGVTGDRVQMHTRQQFLFAIAAILISILGSVASVALERVVLRQEQRGNEANLDMLHLYDYVSEYGQDGLAYVIGRLWFHSMMSWIGARGLRVDGEGVQQGYYTGDPTKGTLVAVAVAVTVLGLVLGFVVRKFFRRVSLFARRAAAMSHMEQVGSGPNEGRKKRQEDRSHVMVIGQKKQGDTGNSHVMVIGKKKHVI